MSTVILVFPLTLSARTIQHKIFFLGQSTLLVLKKVHFSRNIFCSYNIRGCVTINQRGPWLCKGKVLNWNIFLCEWKSLKGRIRTSTLNGIRENASEITHTSIRTAFCINAHRMLARFWRTSEYVFQLR